MSRDGTKREVKMPETVREEVGGHICKRKRDDFSLSLFQASVSQRKMQKMIRQLAFGTTCCCYLDAIKLCQHEAGMVKRESTTEDNDAVCECVISILFFQGTAQ